MAGYISVHNLFFFPHSIHPVSTPLVFMRVTGELEPISAADVGVATYVQVSRKSQDPTGKIQGKGEWQK